MEEAAEIAQRGESMRLGNVEIRRVSGGTLWVDGGCMFGPVPRSLWQNACPPDKDNRVLLETNCLLVRTTSSLALVDTGFGRKPREKQREIYSLSGGNCLIEGLAREGVAPHDIDLVILTHLHFDHAGGCTVRNDDETLRPVFPRARYVVQDVEWSDATRNIPELKGAYFPKDLEILASEGLVDLVDGSHSVTEEIRVELTGGHTRGHQVVHIESEGERALYIADLCAFSSHLKVFWTMAYDQCQLDVRRQKMRLLNQAASTKTLVLFAHDPHVAGAFIGRKSDHEFVLNEAVVL